MFADPNDGPPSGADDVELELAELMRLYGRFIRAFRGAARFGDVKQMITQAGCGPRHLPVLMMLGWQGPQSVGELAGHIGLSPATTSQMVGELEKAGYVRRDPDPADRRRMIVSLAERHADAVTEFARLRNEPFRHALREMSPETRTHFIQGWRLLVEAQERMGHQDS